MSLSDPVGGDEKAMSSSSALEKGEGHGGAPSEPQQPPMGTFQEPQIEKWKLVSLYVRWAQTLFVGIWSVANSCD